MTGPTDETGTGGESQPSVPTCYRHPDRETYIRCARCNRYICPDCMTAAPVGFQCPECIAEGRKSVRTATTAIGGQIRENGDIVTKVLVGLNVIVWVIVLAAGDSAIVPAWKQVTEDFGLVMGVQGDSVTLGVADGQWYRLLTAGFIHEAGLHLGLNMLALWFLGSALEPVLGRWRFIALYLLALLGGSAVSVLTAGEPYSMSVGASGAVYGLFGALFVVMRRLGRDVRPILVILAINVVYGFTAGNIDWRAHFGGLGVGLVLAAAFAHAPRKHRTSVAIAACVVVLAAIAATVVVGLS